MKIELKSGSYIHYHYEDDIIIVDQIKSYNKGDGTALINEIKKENKTIELIAYAQDDSIEQEQLINFYKKNGFEFHVDDVDYTYMVY